MAHREAGKLLCCWWCCCDSFKNIGPFATRASEVRYQGWVGKLGNLLLSIYANFRPTVLLSFTPRPNGQRRARPTPDRFSVATVRSELAKEPCGWSEKFHETILRTEPVNLWQAPPGFPGPGSGLKPLWIPPGAAPVTVFLTSSRLVIQLAGLRRVLDACHLLQKLLASSEAFCEASTSYQTAEFLSLPAMACSR
ncbi:hypothetical protein BU16DRAFT_588393 [Lophium mytilinum]|uniref:Uncharacterized protein n=1 Tax=Lophium mytilinum TaxID=390894 RepID=A0A6A6RDW6_9PEZI|nr:hypothetical protein BU16DRAFT_588393 [Lophium mytilinum]